VLRWLLARGEHEKFFNGTYMHKSQVLTLIIKECFDTMPLGGGVVHIENIIK
jgi:hypothetical protein